MQIAEHLRPVFLRVEDGSDEPASQKAQCVWHCDGCDDEHTTSYAAARAQAKRFAAHGLPFVHLCPSCGRITGGTGDRLETVPAAASAFRGLVGRPGIGAGHVSTKSNQDAEWACDGCDAVFVHTVHRVVRSALLRLEGQRNGPVVVCDTCSGHRATPERNMVTLEPEMAAQFIRCIDDPSLSAYDLLPKSGLLCEWECPEGHLFEETPHQRMNMSGADHCPVCSPTGRRSYENGNIEEDHPALAGRFVRCVDDPGRTPRELTRRSHFVCEWRCDECGTEDVGIVANQADECPVCNGYVIGLDTCLKALFPGVAEQFLENLDAPGQGPDVIGPSSSYRCMWQAACGHKPWQATPHSRTKLGSDCPRCNGFMSKPEVQLWHELSAFVDLLPHGHPMRMNGKGRPVIPDIVIPSLMVIIEYDGVAYHSSPEKVAKDRLRNRQYAEAGYRTIRAREHDLPALGDDDLLIPLPYGHDHPGKFVADRLLPHLEALLGVELVSSCGMSVDEYVASRVPLRAEEAAADLAPSRARSQEELAERDAAALESLGWDRGRVAAWYAEDGSATRLGVELGGWGPSRVLRLLRWWNIPRNLGGNRRP